MALPKQITELSDALSSLPGVGPKLSSRLALFLATNGKNVASSLQDKINKMIASIGRCEICNNVATEDICEICSDELRDQSIIFVVEDALDLYNIEATNEFKGLYHVLGGVISPINGIGPDELYISGLVKRLKSGTVKELILGLNPNIEGESTSLYLKNEIDQMGVEIAITRLAKGIPAGSDIEFMSSQTLTDSMRSRNQF